MRAGTSKLKRRQAEAGKFSISARRLGERHLRAAEHDKSWSAHGIDIPELIAKICLYDPYVGAMLRLMWALGLGLRKKESIMFRPHLCIAPFGAAGLPLHKKQADYYVRVEPGSKGGRERFVPLDSPERIAAIDHAKTVVSTGDGHMGNPSRSLKQNMTHFSNVMKKFGITKEKLGVTSHGLRHEALINKFERPHWRSCAGARRREAADGNRHARAAASCRARRHSKRRASSAYIGGIPARTSNREV